MQKKRTSEGGGAMIKAIKSIQTFTKPEKELKNPDNLNFKMKIWTTTYIVNAHFSDKAQDDIANKIKSLMTR